VNLGRAPVRDRRAEESGKQQHVAERDREELLRALHRPLARAHVNRGNRDRHDHAEQQHEHSVRDAEIADAPMQRDPAARREHAPRDQ
jgi:hypothetical protein